MAVYNARHGTCTLHTGDATTFELTIEDVGLSIDGLQADNREALPVYDRGSFDGLVAGQDTTQSFSTTFKVKNESLTHASNARALDFLLKLSTGSQASGTTVDAYGFEWALKIVITLDDGTTSTSKTLPVVRCTVGYTEALEGCAFAISGTNYKAPTFA